MACRSCASPSGTASTTTSRSPRRRCRLQQNVNLPNNVLPQIQASSLVGEVYRYQVVGPPNFGLTNLRTVQDWILQRRFLTVPGVVQVNTWGGTTKEYEVEVDLHKLDAYNVTMPQVIAAIGNANVNVGGRTINFGQQSVNMRGVGLIDSGGSDDLTQGYKVNDIENISLAQSNGVPVQVKDVAKVSIGNVPRLGKAGRDKEDDVVAAILVMNRTLHTNDVVPRIEREVEKINSDGTLPPGVKIIPFYDRTALVNVTTHTVLHNLIFGCVLVFLIQWMFLGDLRSAIIVGVNIPFALFFSIIILVLMGEDANLLVGRRRRFRHHRRFRRDPGGERLPQFPGEPGATPGAAAESRRRALGHRSDQDRRLGGGHASAWTDRLRMILISAMEVDTAVFFSAADHGRGLRAAVHHAGGRRPDLQPDGPHLRFRARRRAACDLHHHAGAGLVPASRAHRGDRDHRGARAARLYSPALHFSLTHRKLDGRVRRRLPGLHGSPGAAARDGIPAGARRRQSVDPGLDAADHLARSCDALGHQDARNHHAHPEVITVVSQHGRPDNGSDASGFYNAEFFVPLKPFDEWPSGHDQGEARRGRRRQQFADEFAGITFNFSQYIQDNIEEGLSGVKGANSVKIVGPDLAKLEEIANQVLPEMDQVKGVADLGIFRVLGQPNLNVKVDRDKAARYGLNSGDVNAVVQAALGGTVATTQLEADRQFNVTVRLRAAVPRRLRCGRQRQSRLSRPRTAPMPISRCASSPTITLDTGASYIFHERNARFIPIKFSVRGRDLGTTVAEAQERIAKNIDVAERLPHRMGGRVRGAAAGQGASRDRRADQPGADPRPALRPVQFAPRQLSWRSPAFRSRSPAASSRCYITGLDFCDLGGDRLRVAVRSIGDERHPDHHLFQPGPRQQRHEHDRSDVPRRRATDAADADDRALGLYRPAAGRRSRTASAARCRGRSPSSSSAACWSAR